MLEHSCSRVGCSSRSPGQYQLVEHNCLQATLAWIFRWCWCCVCSFLWSCINHSPYGSRLYATARMQPSFVHDSGGSFVSCLVPWWNSGSFLHNNIGIYGYFVWGQRWLLLTRLWWNGGSTFMFMTEQLVHQYERDCSSETQQFVCACIPGQWQSLCDGISIVGSSAIRMLAILMCWRLSCSCP